MRASEFVIENLRKWFKEKWVRFNPQGKIMGPCARGADREGKPKCLPQAKAHALGKKGRAAAAARKRRQDPNPERSGKAKNVATKVNETEKFIKKYGAGFGNATTNIYFAAKNAKEANGKVVAVTSNTFKVVPKSDPRPAVKLNPDYDLGRSRIEPEIKDLQQQLKNYFAMPFNERVQQYKVRKKIEQKMLALRKELESIPKAVEDI